MFQALAGYAYSWLFAATGGDHRVLMEIGAAALAVALVSDLLLARAAWAGLAGGASGRVQQEA